MIGFADSSMLGITLLPKDEQNGDRSVCFTVTHFMVVLLLIHVCAMQLGSMAEL